MKCLPTFFIPPYFFSTRDVHHRFIYPTPELEIDHPRIKSVPDPALVSVDGVIFGFTSTDILFHLGKEEISYPPRFVRKNKPEILLVLSILFFPDLEIVCVG